MDDPVDLIGRIGVRRRMGRLEAAALIDRDIHQHRTPLHRLQHLPRDQLRRARAWDENGTDHGIGCENLLFDRLDRGETRADSTLEQLIEFTQPGERPVQDRDLRT